MLDIKYLSRRSVLRLDHLGDGTEEPEAAVDLIGRRVLDAGGNDVVDQIQQRRQSHDDPIEQVTHL